METASESVTEIKLCVYQPNTLCCFWTFSLVETAIAIFLETGFSSNVYRLPEILEGIKVGRGKHTVKTWSGDKLKLS
jgi:hypothetical protein